VLDWERLPARVEAIIAERIGRLAAPSREALRVASVEGEVFTAEVAAQVRATDEREMVQRLSGELDKRQRLVRAEAIQRLGTRRLSRYRFRHFLFQQYLYNSLDTVERAYLHEAVGTTLEALYGEEAGEIAVDLARHFQEAGLTDKAIEYLQRAGGRAVRILANEEAIAHFQQALALLASLPHTPERDQVEIALQLALGTPLVACSGFTAPEFGQAMARARQLCQRTDGGDSLELISALFFLNIYHGLRAEYREAIELGEEALHLAQRAEDPLLIAWAHFSLGWVLDCVGDFFQARAHLEQVSAFYDPEQHRSLALRRYGADPGVFALAWVTNSLWYLGYPDQALHRSQEALALAQALDHPFTLVQALGSGVAMTRMRRREVQAAQEYIQAELRLSSEKRFVHYQAAADCRQGWAFVDAGQVEEGIAHLRQALTARQAMGANTHRTLYSIQLAEGYRKAGRVEEGLDVLAEASLIMQDTGERCCEAELYRVRGELLLTPSVGDEAEAEASFHQAETCFQHAIEVARQQSAKSWELRATKSLCRLWRSQGKREAARQILEKIYGWFTEGFDTGDLQEAKTLLEELEQGSAELTD
jgi:predicted ATPase